MKTIIPYLFVTTFVMAQHPITFEWMGDEYISLGSTFNIQLVVLTQPEITAPTCIYCMNSSQFCATGPNLSLPGEVPQRITCSSDNDCFTWSECEMFEDDGSRICSTSRCGYTSAGISLAFEFDTSKLQYIGTTWDTTYDAVPNEFLVESQGTVNIHWYPNPNREWKFLVEEPYHVVVTLTFRALDVTPNENPALIQMLGNPSTCLFRGTYEHNVDDCMESNYPGKFIRVNSLDRNSDGIIDLADYDVSGGLTQFAVLQVMFGRQIP